ncbi:MAG: aldo/keto reductase [Candidatus Aenigmatarchaeota archaeon]
MRQRRLGRTGMRVSEIGFGSWAIGGSDWGKQSDRDSADALNRALNLGCNFFDTALSYGEGHSEKLIGDALRKNKALEDVIIATKVPPKNGLWEPPIGQPISEAFPSDWIIECCNKSLKNLGRSYIDLLQLHTWNKSWGNETDWHETLLKLRDDGKIRAFGISVSGPRPDEANAHVTRGMVDTIQVVYNILNQSAEDVLLPLAKEHNVGIICRVPLASGGLTGKFTDKTSFANGDWRRETEDSVWLLSMVKQVGKVERVINNSMPLHEAAIKFCLSNPAVSTVIAGARNAKQAELNFGVPSGDLAPQKLAELRKMWRSGEIGNLRFP